MKYDQGAFAIVPADLFDLRVSGSAILVFTALATFTGKDRIVWPSLTTVGKMVGMKERSVRQPLGELEEAGVISRVARHDQDGRQLSNVYRLDILLSHLANRGDPRFVKHPATWLNAHCRLDEPDPQAKREKKWWEKRLEEERAREARERRRAAEKNDSSS